MVSWAAAGLLLAFLAEASGLLRPPPLRVTRRCPTALELWPRISSWLVGGGGSSTISGNEAEQPTAAAPPVCYKDTVILGAGMAGLACATYLQRAGKKDFVILEASGAPGGRVGTDVHEDH